ncbi:peptidase [Sesbania bispinosa]|nr:peptidase [Sesbania bispinosa]
MPCSRSSRWSQLGCCSSEVAGHMRWFERVVRVWLDWLPFFQLLLFLKSVRLTAGGGSVQEKLRVIEFLNFVFGMENSRSSSSSSFSSCIVNNFEQGKNEELEDIVEAQNVELGILQKKLDVEREVVHILTERRDTKKAAVKLLAAMLSKQRATMKELNETLDSCKEEAKELYHKAECYKAEVNKNKLVLCCIVILVVAKLIGMM